MADVNAVILPAHYVGIDTDGGNQSYSPDEVAFKKYRLENIGTSGNTATISLTGADDIVLNDGEVVEIVYSSSAWQDVSKLPSLTVAGDTLLEGGVELTSGRKAFDEKSSQSVSSAGTSWKRIAWIPNGIAFAQGLATIKVSAYGASRVGNMSFEAGYGGNISDPTKMSCNIKSLVYSTGTSPINGARIISGDNTSSGAYIEVSLNSASTLLVNYNLIGNLGDHINVLGIQLLPIADTNNLPPDGSAATIVVAGADLDLSGNVSIVPGVFVQRSSTVVSGTIIWTEGVPLPLANTITPTFPNTSIELNGNASAYSWTSLSDISISLVRIKGNRLDVTMTNLTGTFPFGNGTTVSMYFAGTGGKFTLSKV